MSARKQSCMKINNQLKFRRSSYPNIVQNGTDKKSHNVIQGSDSEIVVTYLLIQSRQDGRHRGCRVFFSVQSDATRE